MTKKSRAAGGTAGTIATGAMAAWLQVATGVAGPFRLSAAGGTCGRRDRLVAAPDGRRWTLRQPSPSRALPAPLDLADEYRVLAALTRAPVAAPEPVAVTADPAVAPLPCLLVKSAEGMPLAELTAIAGDSARAAVEALADVHELDWQAAGLAGLGGPAGSLGEQVYRWRARYEQNQVRDLPLLEQVSSWLQGNIPASAAPALVHGSFRLSNCRFDAAPPARVSCVVNWELAAVGDPLADLGLLLGLWTRRLIGPGAAGPPDRSGELAYQDLAAYYASLTGRSVADLPFYMTLALFRLAVAAEVAYAGFVSGQVTMGYGRVRADEVPRLLSVAAAVAHL